MFELIMTLFGIFFLWACLYAVSGTYKKYGLVSTIFALIFMTMHFLNNRA